ncbi:MAG: class I SAM-dependent methyltransferase [Planctomycetales bacterium]|nr:class I SAM-dependent methyltransferase [Planctomycetales bacterium]
MTIRYGLSNDADSQYRKTIERITTSTRGLRICEIGGGANPAIPIEVVEAYDMDYTIVDVSETELAKAPSGYRKICADITEPDHPVTGPYDLVFSFWCAEHVYSGQNFHSSIFRMLADGGRAMHLFPTLYSPPFVFNYLVPDSLSEKLLLWLQPHREADGDHGKFPAHYSWCVGPTKRQIERLEHIGYTVEEYASFFGHSGKYAFGAAYLDRVPALRWLHERVTEALVRHPNPYLTTYAYVVLGKGTSVPESRLEASIPRIAESGLSHSVVG